MALTEVLDLACPFAGQERTDGVDEPPARPNQLRADIEKPHLEGDDPLEAIRRQTPAALRVAPPGAAAAAWGVDQDEVGLRPPFGQLFEFVGRAQKSGF